MTSRTHEVPQAREPRSTDTPSKPGTSDIETTPLAWVAKLAKRLLAHSLNMPEPMLHHTGVFVFAHVQAAEDRAVKTLCPFTLLRQAIALRRNRSS